MSHRFRLSPALGQRLRELGVAPDSVLRQAGLPSTLFAQTRIWLSTEELFAFYKAARDVSADPAIGLKLGSEQRLERYSPLAIAALYSRSFGEAMHRLARYKRIVGPEEIQVTENQQTAAVRFVWLLAHEPEPDALIDGCFAWTLTIGQRGTGRPIRPLLVEFTRPEQHRAVYEEFFGCPIRFAAEQNRLLFPAADMDARFVTHNPELLALVAPQLESELSQQLAESTLKQQVKGILRKLLTGHRPRLEDLASEMRISPRTLQRRLLAEQMTFHGIVEEARRELAQHYLLHSSMELNETAYLLGYEDPNSFIRAFSRWEGSAPGEWRSAQRQLAARSN